MNYRDGSTRSLIPQSMVSTGETLSSLETTERMSQYDFCVTKRNSTLSAIPSSHIMDSEIISDNTNDLIGTDATLPPKLSPEPSPQKKLVTKSKIIRVTSPRADSKFEIEQDAFEQWLVTKLKAEELKRQKQIDMENELKKEKKAKAEKAQKAHEEWLKQKEEESKKIAEKQKKLQAKKTKSEQDKENKEIEKRQKAEEKYKLWLEAKESERKRAAAKIKKQKEAENKKLEEKRKINDEKFKEWLKKQHQTNPDIKSDIKPRDARWIDPTPKTHPELVKIKSRPQTAPSRSSSRTSYSRPMKRELFTLRDSTCFINWR